MRLNKTWALQSHSINRHRNSYMQQIFQWCSIMTMFDACGYILSAFSPFGDSMVNEKHINISLRSVFKENQVSKVQYYACSSLPMWAARRICG